MLTSPVAIYMNTTDALPNQLFQYEETQTYRLVQGKLCKACNWQCFPIYQPLTTATGSPRHITASGKKKTVFTLDFFEIFSELEDHLKN